PLCCRAPISLCQRLAPPRTLSYAPSSPRFVLFFLNAPSTTQFYSLSLHDALPIFIACAGARRIEDDEVEGRRRNGAHRPHPSGDRRAYALHVGQPRLPDVPLAESGSGGARLHGDNLPELERERKSEKAGAGEQIQSGRK